MKTKKQFLIVLMIMCVHIGFGQSYKAPNPSTAAEVEVILNQYTLANESTVTLKFTKEELADQKHLNRRQLAALHKKMKASVLRRKFFDKNPQYIPLYKPNNSALLNCVDAGFENGTLNYGFAQHQFGGNPIAEFDNCAMQVNTVVPILPGLLNNINADVAPVSGGLDPILNNFGFALNRTNTGNRAVRLNAGNGGRDITTMTDNITITNDTYVFNFAAVIQNPAGHNDDQPFFQVRILDQNNNLLAQNCIVSNANDCIFIDTMQQINGATVLYSNWSCFAINTSQFIGQNVTIEYSIADCGLTGHFGYVYIDDLCQSVCTNGAFGSINLSPVDGDCPEFPVEVCGTYTPPQAGTPQQGVLSTITLSAIDSTGNTTVMSTTPTTLTANTFCFTLQQASLPATTGTFELQVDAVFQMNCTANPVPVNLQDTSSNIGPDISLDGCCEGEMLPLNLGYGSTWQRRSRDVVIDSDGNFYVLFDRMRNQSQQWTDIAQNDFTNGTFILKFDKNQCFIDSVELLPPLPIQESTYYGNLEIDSQNNLYASLNLRNKFIKLNSNLDIIYDNQMTTWFVGNTNGADPQGPFVPLSSRMAYAGINSLAQINNTFVVNPQPVVVKGPVVTLINTATGLPYNPYVFDIPVYQRAAVGSQALEVTNNSVYISFRIYQHSQQPGANFTFGSSTISIAPGQGGDFIAKFNIIGNSLIPDVMIATNERYTTLEYNAQNNYLYAGNNNNIDVFNGTNLGGTFLTSNLGGTELSDMQYDWNSETLLVATSSNVTENAHLRLFNATLNNPVWESTEAFGGGQFEGVYVPKVYRKDDNIYLTGIYKKSSPLDNGLPASVDYDTFIEYIDINNPPSLLEETETEIKKAISRTLYSVYPNPSKGTIYVQSKLEGISTIDVEIFDFNGNSTFSKENMAFENSIPLQLQQLRNGIYFLQIKNETGRIETHQVIIKK